MSHLFEKKVEAPADRGGDASETIGSPFDPPYHDYSVTYRSLGETSRRKAVWMGVLLVTFLGAALGLAAYLFVGN